MPRWPIDIVRVTPHGKYGYLRKKGEGRGCGRFGKDYPCRHLGIDLAGVDGTPVYAPEDSSIDSMGTGAFPPFTGYGPGAIIMRGKKTGVYHLLAHLNPASMPSPMVPGSTWDFMTTPLWKSTDQRRQVKEGELIGYTSDANHVHWEVRHPGWNGARTDPALWVKKYVSPSLVRKDYSDAESDSAGGGGGAVILLLALVLFGDSKGNRR